MTDSQAGTPFLAFFYKSSPSICAAMKTFLILILLALALGGAGLWLLLRQHSNSRLAAALLLLLTSTAAGYTGVRLWLETTALPPTSFTRTAPPGQFQVVTPAQLPAALAASRGQPVLLEFYADWCPSCLVWKSEVFNRDDVRSTMQPLSLLQIDATELTPDVQAMLDQFGIAGLPALLVFDRSGKEQPELRLLGEMKAADFMLWVTTEILQDM